MPALTEVFKALNELEEHGVIRKYAIAGAMAFLFYTEPARTYDVDVFVLLPPQSTPIFSMQPLYAELQSRGYALDAEHIMIAETPVQFLPVYNPLAEEAIDQAVFHEYDGVRVRVIAPEHLAALAYQTGGRHRLTRAEALEEAGGLDIVKLETICRTHGIVRKSGG
jgi:hypothetical protein